MSLNKGMEMTKKEWRQCSSISLVNNRWLYEQTCNQYLWHVESRLSDGELEDAAGSLCVSQDRLQLSKLDPGGAVLRTELQVFLVQLSAAVELT